MSIKLEASETATLKLLQEKASEATKMVQDYATLLSKKYELSANKKFVLTPDLTQIVELPANAGVGVPAASVQEESDTTEQPAPRRRKVKEVPVAEVAAA